MRVYAITGSIATGKSTISQIFEEKGFKVIDADKVTDNLYKQGNLGYKAMQIHFTQFVGGKKIKKAELMDLISMDKEAKEFLESIMHPLIMADIQKRLKSMQDSGAQVAFVEMPLLFEAKMENLFSGSISVTCTPEEQVNRLMKRSKISKEMAEKLISMHLPQATIDKKANAVIDTNVSKQEIVKQIDEFLNNI